MVKIDENVWINEKLVVKVMIREDGDECQVIIRMVDGENLEVCRGTYWECRLYVRNKFEAKDSEWW